MYCFKCGKEIADNAIFCQHCGTQIVKNKNSSKKIIAFTTIACVISALSYASYKWYEEYKHYMERNPVLNSENDITRELINKIISNDLASLTINYEFTSCEGQENRYSEWVNRQLKTNPFWIANTITDLKKNRI